jgi:sulfate permease
MSSCYVAFAIGANNVANASGPIASMVLNELGIDANSEDNFIMIITVTTLIIAPCFAIGSSLFGYRLLQSTGKGIVEFGLVGASLISIVTATLLIACIHHKRNTYLPCTVEHICHNSSRHIQNGMEKSNS